MKTETIKHVPDTEIREMVQALIEKAGSVNKAASEIGESRTMLSQFVNGYDNPGRKMLDYFGLEKKVVYQPKVLNEVKS